MRGLGTIINIITILVGGTLGLILGKKFNTALQKAVMDVNGLVSIVIGIQMALSTKNILYVLISLLIGTLTGELINIHGFIENMGKKLEGRFDSKSGGKFTRAFMMTSIIFCVGPMTILGSIQDGLTGNFSLLATKSILDGFGSIAFSASLGIGVLFTVITVFVIQGGLTLFAGLLSGILTTPVIAEITSVGGIMIISIGLGLLEIKKIKTANMLPALIIAPILVYLTSLFIH